MLHISRAERKAVLDLLASLPEEGSLADSRLVDELSDWIERHRNASGFGYNLQINLLFLCDFLRRNPRHPCAVAARRALRYVALNKDVVPDDTPDVGLLDDAFVASYAVNEIRCTLGDQAALVLPQLGEADRTKSEELFSALMEKSSIPDDLLIDRAKGFLAEHSSPGLFWNRLLFDVETLLNVILSPRENGERATAKAALEYLLRKDDAVHDDLSLVGRLDDFFILELAMELIGLTRNAWSELVRENIAKWPFLGEIAFVDANQGDRPLSEFLLINGGMTLLAFDAPGGISKLAMAVPSGGPLPALLGFLAGLGMTRRHVLTSNEHGSSHAFSPGDKVQIDGKGIGIFQGLVTESGKEFFIVRQDRKVRIPGGRSLGNSSICVRIPASELYRLVPARASRQTRGKITSRLDERSVPVTVLESLLHLSNPLRNFKGIPPVYVVTPIGEAHTIVRSLKLQGELLADILPMGAVGRDGDFIQWSARFGKQAPMIRFSPDLDSACEAMEESPSKTSYLIAEMLGRNASKSASLARIGGEATGTVVLARTWDADNLGFLADRGYTLWEWSQRDLSELAWSPSSDFQAIGPYEERLKRSGNSKPRIIRLQLPEIDQLVRRGKAIEHSLGAQRRLGQGELDEMINVIYGWTSRILRLATVPCPSLKERMESDAGWLRRQSGSPFFTAEQQEMTTAFVEALRSAMECLLAHNPKEEALRQVRTELDGISVVCRSRKEADSLVDIHGDQVTDCGDLDGFHENGAVFLGWYGHSRMAPWLYPPMATPLVLLLYDAESAWLRSSAMRQSRSRTARNPEEARARLYPKLAVRGTDQDKPDSSEDGEEEDQVEREAVAQWRCICNKARSNNDEPEVEARPVLFQDESHAFLTSNFEGNVVTHLLTSRPDEEAKPEVRVARRSELVPGDVLLFVRGSSKDAIRQVADQMLPAGQRDLARLWQSALLRYQKARGLPADAVFGRLRQAGCTHHLSTIKNWLTSESIIAPRDAHDHELALIRELTQDEELVRNFDACDNAIRTVWGAHLSASNHLAAQVLEHAADLLTGSRRSQQMDLGDNVVLATIDSIQGEDILVRRSLTNRLLDQMDSI